MRTNNYYQKKKKIYVSLYKPIETIMQVIILLIILSLVLASVFLFAFIWANKTGQFEDQQSPSVRILSEDEIQEHEI